MKKELSKNPGAIRSRRYRAKLKKKKKLANAQMKLDKKLSKVANSVQLGGEVVRGEEIGTDTVPAVMPNEAQATL